MKRALLGIVAASLLLTTACSMEVIVTPAARADTEWNNLNSSEQRQLCDLHIADPDTFREATFQSLRSELGWTNETSMWEYWIVLTSHCETEDSASTATPSSPPQPSAPSETPTSEPTDSGTGELGESGYPVKDEDAYLAAVRADPVLGEIGRTTTDDALFYVAVPICVGVRDESVPIKDVKAALKKVDLDPRYISSLVRVSLEYLCPG